ncbi:MAG: hypothetical protein SCALA702_23440 [Melioribacteraceae bacterium]|nr:MAG: hypothetical protein SCALA702_23440 [Melioribacteraceae bacterium]
MNSLNKFFGILIFLSSVLIGQTPDYKKMDKYALSAPEHLKGKPKELAAYLIKPAENDFEKIRGIFRWVTNNIDYDVEGYLSGGDIYKSPEEAIKSGSAVCDGYAGVVSLLAGYAGLEVVKISGFSKGYSYSVGDKMGRSNHAWNAVKIDDKWYLFDATWGAGAVDNSGKYNRNFQEHYFLTPPDKFIYDHFPDDKRWQLLDTPLSANEFLALPYLRPQYFETGLNILNLDNNVTRSGSERRIELEAPENVQVTVTLFASGEEDLSTFTFLQREGSKILVDVVFPKSGNYKLRLYSKFEDEPGSYSWAADYGFTVSDGMKNFSGFPLRYEQFNITSSLLYQPVSGALKLNSTYNFRLKVPGAEKVAVIIDGNFFFLTPVKEEANLFAGDVKITGHKIMVGANFGEGNRFEGLLGYSSK